MNIEIPEGDVDAIRARHYFNDTDLSADASGIGVIEHRNVYSRNEFVLQYALLKDKALTNANAWLWTNSAWTGDLWQGMGSDHGPL